MKITESGILADLIIWVCIAIPVSCVVLISLKLSRVIAWSWWAVTSPVWGALGAMAILLLLLLLISTARRLFRRRGYYARR